MLILLLIAPVLLPGEPLIQAEKIVQQREGETIGASVRSPNPDVSGMGPGYESGSALEGLEAAIGAEALAAEDTASGTGGNLLQRIAIAFGIELAVTLLVLSIAFQISGFPSVFRQLLVLSLAVAFVGALLDTLLRMGPLSPIRSIAGLIVLILLIRPLTNVREWAAAIKIAVITRCISIAVLWLVMIGLSMLFSI